jgi:chromosome segregation ATPase
MKNINELQTELSALEKRCSDLTGQRDKAAHELSVVREAVVDGTGDVSELTAKQSAFDALAGAVGIVEQRVETAREVLQTALDKAEKVRRRVEADREVFDAVRAFEEKASEMDAAREEMRQAIFEKLPQLCELFSEASDLGRSAVSTLSRIEKETGERRGMLRLDGEAADVPTIRSLSNERMFLRMLGEQNRDALLEMYWRRLLFAVLDQQVQRDPAAIAVREAAMGMGR